MSANVVTLAEVDRFSSRTIHTDARLVTATNVNLPGMVEEKRFRARSASASTVAPSSSG
jgi:transcriptional regulator with GAF, ATPase, and Fis domain